MRQRVISLTVDVLWTYFGCTLDVLWMYFGRTLDVLWTYFGRETDGAREPGPGPRFRGPSPGA